MFRIKSHLYDDPKTTITMAKKKLDRAKVDALFDKHDYNKDGTIDYIEIKPMLKELGYSEAAIEGCNLNVVSATIRSIMHRDPESAECKNAPYHRKYAGSIVSNVRTKLFLSDYVLNTTTCWETAVAPRALTVLSLVPHTLGSMVRPAVLNRVQIALVARTFLPQDIQSLCVSSSWVNETS